jgi:uncharacterized protein (DUF4415 family)
MVIKMKHDLTSKPSAFSPAQIAAAMAAATEQVHDPECPYDPNDAAAVAAFWANGKLRLPGQRGPQKQATKVPITVRYSQEVVDFFKAGGDGWQTRMNDVLRAYVASQNAPTKP